MFGIPTWLVFQGAVVLASMSIGIAGAAQWYGGKLDRLRDQIKLDAAVQQGRLDMARTELVRKEGERHALETKLREQVKTVVQRPIYRNVCLDPDGLRIANDALENRVTR